MALDRDDHKARIASLLADVPQFKDWIEAVGGLTTDSRGRAIRAGGRAARHPAAAVVERARLRQRVGRQEQRQHDGEGCNRCGSRPVKIEGHVICSLVWLS
jgi:hypothetical protein